VSSVESFGRVWHLTGNIIFGWWVKSVDFFLPGPTAQAPEPPVPGLCSQIFRDSEKNNSPGSSQQQTADRKVSGGVQKLYFCMSRRSAKIAFLHEPEPCKNTIFALRDSPETVSGETFRSAAYAEYKHPEIIKKQHSARR
jgi:hypothetical protein